MKIAVTQEHIDRGQKRACRSCPVALAISAVTGYLTEVGRYFISIWSDDESVRDVPTPRNVRQFIDDFDGCRPVQPFEFDLPDA